MGVSARYHLRHRGHLSRPKERESGRNRAAKLLKKLLAEKPKEKIIFHLIALLWLVILNFLIFPRQFSCASAAARPSVYRFCWFLTCRLLSFGILHGVDVLLVFFFVDIFLIWSYVFHGNFNFFEQIHPPSRKVAITRIDCVWKCLKAIWKKAKKRIEKILKEWKSFEVLS